MVPQAFDGVLNGINAHGDCVGHRITQDGASCAVYLSPRGIQDLGTLGGASSTARGINDDGVVVGGSLITNDDAYHGFVAVDGVMYDLNALIDPPESWEVIHALGINGRGDIVAVANDGTDDRIVVLQQKLKPMV